LKTFQFGDDNLEMIRTIMNRGDCVRKADRRWKGVLLGKDNMPGNKMFGTGVDILRVGNCVFNRSLLHGSGGGFGVGKA
jgi:hypothetical protein